jgi:hypothetical protein
MANEGKCGGSHTKYDGSWWENDARGIPLARVCNECIKVKLAKYRPEVLTDSNYDLMDCPLDEDKW